jgi:excisionase family DNA binding protein
MRIEQLFERMSHHSENSNMSKTPPPGKTGEFVTTAQAARVLKVTMSRVRQLIMDGQLKSYGPEKGRRDNLLKLSDVKLFHRDAQKPAGRPPEDDDKKE